MPLWVKCVCVCLLYETRFSWTKTVYDVMNPCHFLTPVSELFPLPLFDLWQLDVRAITLGGIISLRLNYGVDRDTQVKRLFTRCQLEDTTLSLGCCRHSRQITTHTSHTVIHRGDTLKVMSARFLQRGSRCDVTDYDPPPPSPFEWRWTWNGLLRRGITVNPHIMQRAINDNETLDFVRTL